MEHVGHRQNRTELTDIYQRSPAIWASCPLAFIKKFHPECHVRWDATRMSLAGTQTTQIAGPIPGTKVFASSGGAVDAVSAVNSVEKWGGAIQFGVDTDNEGASLAQAYPTFRMSGLKGTDQPLYFEACWALSSILTNTVGVLVGMAETELLTLSATVPLAATDVPDAAGAMIGFHKGEDALGVIDTVYADRAATFTDVGADEADLSAANTFVKTGFLYNPGQLADYDSSRVVRFFQDNLELNSAISKSTLTGLTNLDANALGPIFAIISDTGGTAVKAYLKWLEVAQLPPGVYV